VSQLFLERGKFTLQTVHTNTVKKKLELA